MCLAWGQAVLLALRSSREVSSTHRAVGTQDGVRTVLAQISCAGLVLWEASDKEGAGSSVPSQRSPLAAQTRDSRPLFLIALYKQNGFWMADAEVPGAALSPRT